MVFNEVKAFSASAPQSGVGENEALALAVIPAKRSVSRNPDRSAGEAYCSIKDSLDSRIGENDGGRLVPTLQGRNRAFRKDQLIIAFIGLAGSTPVSR